MGDRPGSYPHRSIVTTRTNFPIVHRFSTERPGRTLGDVVSTPASEIDRRRLRPVQSIAEPNTVVIAESTRKLVGNLFDLQDLGVQDLKGLGAAVSGWAVLRPASQILPVLSSFPSLFRLQKWTELNHPSAGGGEARGVLPCMR
jgi:hypothetical protein